MYSEFDVRQHIKDIEDGDQTPIRKARRLITLSHDIRRFSKRLRHGADILESEDQDGALERLQGTLNCLHRLHDEARLAAFRALKCECGVSLGLVGPADASRLLIAET